MQKFLQNVIDELRSWTQSLIDLLRFPIQKYEETQQEKKLKSKKVRMIKQSKFYREITIQSYLTQGNKISWTGGFSQTINTSLKRVSQF